LVEVTCEALQENRGDGTWALRVERSKTNQEGTKQDFRFVSDDTVRRIEEWKTAAGITEGPIFLSLGGRPKHGKAPPPYLRPQQVARIYRRRALQAGLPDAGVISGHSTRVGTALDLSNNGATTREIALAGGWASEESVGRYTRKSDAGRNAVARLRSTKRPAP
jgi:integrase